MLCFHPPPLGDKWSRPISCCSLGGLSGPVLGALWDTGLVSAAGHTRRVSPSLKCGRFGHIFSLLLGWLLLLCGGGVSRGSPLFYFWFRPSVAKRIECRWLALWVDLVGLAAGYRCPFFFFFSFCFPFLVVECENSDFFIRFPPIPPPFCLQSPPYNYTTHT